MGSSLTWELSIPLNVFAEAAVASKMVAIAVFIVGGYWKEKEFEGKNNVSGGNETVVCCSEAWEGVNCQSNLLSVWCKIWPN